MASVRLVLMAAVAAASAVVGRKCTRVYIENENRTYTIVEQTIGGDKFVRAVPNVGVLAGKGIAVPIGEAYSYDEAKQTTVMLAKHPFVGTVKLVGYSCGAIIKAYVSALRA